jgi:hypothetical protein
LIVQCFDLSEDERKSLLLMFGKQVPVAAAHIFRRMTHEFVDHTLIEPFPGTV